ncbi:hypothetical protein COXBURSA331_A0049 [Coxiella burnetii RSA 331]|nr:hypothetical protein COXBURSA331_A0049 [Coxiella burnetii RSA 331]
MALLPQAVLLQGAPLPETGRLLVKPLLPEEALLLALLLQGRVLFLKTFLCQEGPLMATHLLREDWFQ